jgi:hypothetical protein
MDAAAVFDRVRDTRLTAADRLAAAGRLSGWLEATKLALTAEIAAAGGLAEAELGDAGRLSGRSVMREMARVGVVEQAPPLRDALANGDVSVDHVDALGRALGKLDESRRGQLLDATDELVDIARGTTPERFDKVLRERVRELLTEADQEAILERQRRAVRLHIWIDQVTGMWNIRGELDPVTGELIQTALEVRHDTLYAQQVPDTAPDDPTERAAHLRGLAFADLILKGGGAIRPEVLTVTHSCTCAGNPAVEWRHPIEVPQRVLDDLFADPNTIVTNIVVRGTHVLHAPGVLNLGRTTRLANRAQRRALQAIHSTCAIEGCSVPFHRCKIHHVIWWRHGGTTDLWNLTPLCTHHHTHVHLGLIELPPPRSSPVRIRDDTGSPPELDGDVIHPVATVDGCCGHDHADPMRRAADEQSSP